MIYPDRTISNLLLASTTMVLLLGANSLAYGELKEFSGIEGRTFHEFMYRTDNCSSCHGVDDPVGYPEDGTCITCHSVDRLVEETMSESEEDRWQNPHDSLHWGRDVPCVECHGEHSNKAPLCADCHNFDYPGHQY